MINGIVGLPGHGKTLEAVRRAVVEHGDGDTHVYANIPLNLEHSSVVMPVELASVRAGGCECGCSRVFVLLDEVHLWLPSRRSLQLPTSWLALFSQTRKLGWELWWTAQHETRVDRMLRDVTSFMYLANAWVWPIEFYIYEMWSAESFRNPRKRMRKDVRRRSRSASEAYNTLGSVVGADHVRDARDPYAPQPQGVAARAVAAGGAPATPARRELSEAQREAFAELFREQVSREEWPV